MRRCIALCLLALACIWIVPASASEPFTVAAKGAALIDGASPAGLNKLQQSAAETNGSITGIVGAVQDMISGEAKSELFTDIQKCVTGQMSPEEAVEAAVRLNEEP